MRLMSSYLEGTIQSLGDNLKGLRKWLENKLIRNMVVVAILIIGGSAIGLTYLEIIGEELAQVIISFALVLVTVVYAKYTRGLLQENREERKLIERQLKESRRPVILRIASKINDIVQRSREIHLLIRESQDDEYPSIHTISELREPLKQDIWEANTEFISLYARLRELETEYSDLHREATSLLEDGLREETDMLGSEKARHILDKYDKSDDSSRINDYIGIMARYSLTGQRNKDFYDELISEHQSEISDIKNTEELGNKLNRMSNLKKEVDQTAIRLVSEGESMIESYREEFDIYASEIDTEEEPNAKVT